MEPFIQYVLREMRVIAGAPVAFGAALLILAAASWWAIDWRYGTLIAHRESEISILKTERDEYKDQLAAAPIVSKPQRHLTDDQKLKLVEALKPLVGDIQQIPVFAEAAREPTIFAVEFIGAFKAAGITPVGPISVIPNYATESGILVGLIDPDKPSDLAKKYMDAFRAANIKISNTRLAVQIGKFDFDLYICGY
jgi:hypothetical protein